MSRSWAEIDGAAIRDNVAALIRLVRPTTKLCAVVKANGYGHGAVTAAAAAIEGGASYLAVANVDEGVALRQAGFEVPIWVLSEPEPHEFVTAAGFDLEPAIYSQRGLQAAEGVAKATSLKVHLKVDTGMHRAGVQPEGAVSLAIEIDRSRGLILGSVWTHLAAADQSEHPYNQIQFDRFDEAMDLISRVGIEVPLSHAANSAAALTLPRAHRDVIRCGIAIYGLAPSPAQAPLVLAAGLRPALSWHSRVSMVKRLNAGDRVSYGLLGQLEADANVATVAVGYADGYRRGLWKQGAVLIGGQRRPILGVITMDQIIVDCGTDEVSAGDEVVLLGRQGGEVISAQELAEWAGTISYEITCGISKRVERV